jgi:hypothetical protein
VVASGGVVVSVGVVASGAIVGAAHERAWPLRAMRSVALRRGRPVRANTGRP